MEIRMGTIGSGVIVRHILKGVERTERITCKAVYSRKEETGRKLADEFGVEKVYTDLDAMCQDEELNFIYVASPNSLHYGQVKKALEYKKNVICEKPFTPTAAEAEELIRMAKDRHLFLFEGVTTLYHPHYSWVREHMTDIGDLKMISCTFCQYSSRYDLLKDGEVTNIFNPEFAGGSLMDINVYNLHFVVGLLGAPDETAYFAGRHENGVDIHGVLLMRYKDVICQCTGAKDTWCENNVQIMGDQGYIRVNPTSNQLRDVCLVQKGGKTQSVHLEEDQWFYEVQELARLVHEENYETCYKNLKNTLEVVRILEKYRNA